MAHVSFWKKEPAAIAKGKQRRGVESEYRRNAKIARARDHGHCRICGGDKALETHHLVPRSLVGKALRNAPSNLLTLCHDCHEQVTRHVLKLYPLDAQEGCNGRIRVEKYDADVEGYVLAMKAA